MMLREYIHLVLESPSNTNVGHGEPFQLSRPVQKALPEEAGLMIGIYREFPLVVTPFVKQAMNITPDEMEPDGTCYVEHEVLIDYQVNNGRVVSWRPYALNGAKLAPVDSEELKEYLLETSGDLTDEEQARVQDAEAEAAY